MQVFERAVEITQTRKNMSMEAVTGELQLQTKYRTMEIKRELDMSVIRGYAYAASSNVTSGDIERRTMAGIISLIRDPDQNTAATDNTTIQNSAVLTADNINSLAYKIFDRGGLDDMADPIILVGPAQQRVIAAMESELRRVEQGERKVGYYRDISVSYTHLTLPTILLV